MRAVEFVAEALKPEAMAALTQARSQIEKNREEELASWTRDVEANWASKMTKTSPAAAQQKPQSQPGAFDQYSYQELKPKLAGINRAIELVQKLEKLKQRAQQAGLLTPGLEADTDVSLYMKDAQADNYAGLIDKAQRGITALTQRMGLRRAAYK
jgi:hypothetical protein